MNTAIIVAAGNSRRMGFDKLFALLGGKPVLAHSIEAFHTTKEIDDLLIVTREDQIGAVEALIKEHGYAKARRVIAGGAERHLSVWLGLQAVDAKSRFVAIHDGARPLTTPALIRECLDLARKHGAACCSQPVPDTVKRAGDDGIVTGSIERSGLWAMQTPQIFSSALILQAYASVIANHEFVTDEVSAVQRVGKKIALLHNDEWNFKITLPRDLELAEMVLGARRKAQK
jgi:2-C-methyl-D-erythritol 4-phosphate cytidylyltransferase